MSDDPRIGSRIADRFDILALVAEGATGRIYRAHQADMNRTVAIKLLHANLGDNPEVKARFQRELRATTRIEHANTVRVYEYGELEDGEWFLAMEHLEGATLADAIVDQPHFPAERAVHISRQIASALAAAHAEKILHRDLKPENIILMDRYGQRDFVKVVDFGLAKISDDEQNSKATVTLSEMRVGTPTYMAPEYVATFLYEPRSDLYALGVILYEMLTGEPPFTGRPYEILEKHVNTPPEPLSTLRPDLPESLVTIVHKLLEKKPEQRYTSAESLANVLERNWARLTTLPPSVPIRASSKPNVLRPMLPVLGLLTGMLLGFLCAGGIVLLWR